MSRRSLYLHPSSKSKISRLWTGIKGIMSPLYLIRGNLQKQKSTHKWVLMWVLFIWMYFKRDARALFKKNVHVFTYEVNVTIYGQTFRFRFNSGKQLEEKTKWKLMNERVKELKMLWSSWFPIR